MAETEAKAKVEAKTELAKKDADGGPPGMFRLNQKVECRDIRSMVHGSGKEEEWELGTKVSLRPLKVLKEGWDIACEWDEIRFVGTKCGGELLQTHLHNSEDGHQPEKGDHKEVKPPILIPGVQVGKLLGKGGFGQVFECYTEDNSKKAHRDFQCL